MINTLSSHFQNSKGTAIEINGRSVFPIFQKKIDAGEKEILVKRINATKLPLQGLRIKVINGNIEVNEISGTEFILWANTSPEQVKIKIISSQGCLLKFWNVWEVDGITQAWVGNAGICVISQDRVTTLECSDGAGDIDFSDLVIQIEE